tara:strand:+ start:8525 stop:8761 length:237 start_codon:yes stop_codon:yes gene_type:complete
MNKVMNHPEVSDSEIVADLFRLARSGQIHAVPELIEAAKQYLPCETEERIKSCIKQLANILWDCDYQGYQSESQKGVA